MLQSPGSLELLVQIDRQQPMPLREQIADQLRLAIRDGRLREGVRLPATRMLAADLGISRGVVVEAYGDLRHQGYIAATGTSAPEVMRMPGATRVAPAPEPEPRRAYRFDLAPEVPDMALFPRREWLRALTFALDTLPDQTFDYGDPRGALELRCALADYLGRTRGVLTDPGCIVVCQGSIQAVDLACRALAADGASRISIEDPCADGIRHACRYAGLEPIPVAVDDEGLVLDACVAASPDAAIVSPAHQFPTGATLSRPRRARLLEWAQRAGTMLIEDDYDAEYSYSSAVVPALQGSAPDRVIHVGSVSKTLAPTIRLGWAVFPPRLAGVAAELKAALDGGSPALEQIALAEMITRSVYEHHLRRVRGEYARRRAAAIAALEARLPGATVSGDGAGLHFAVRLETPVGRRAVEATAEQRRMRVRMLESFLAERPVDARTLLIGYGRLPVEAATPAIEALCGILSSA